MRAWLGLTLLLLTQSTGSEPAIRMTITEKALQYGSHLAAGWLDESLGSTTFPDISGEVSLGALGAVEYLLSGISVSRYDLPEPGLSFAADTGVKAVMDGLSIALHGQWNTHFGLLKDGGSFDLAVFDLHVTILLGVGSDFEGRLSVTSRACTAHVGDAQIDFHGGGSFIFQPFVNFFKNRIREKIEGRICPMVETYVADLEGHLAAMQVSFQVTPALLLDNPLTSSPTVKTSDMELGFKGEFYSTQSHVDPPFSAMPFELGPRSDVMLSLGLSEFCANSALFSYYTIHAFQFQITDGMIPESSPLHLNTSSFGPFIPELPKLFPNMLMSLAIYADNIPMVHFLPGEVTLGLSGVVKAQAILPNATLAPLFSLHLDCSFRGNVKISGDRLKGSVALDNVTLTLISSEVGLIKIAALQQITMVGIKTMALPKLNMFLNQGVALINFWNIHLVNPILTVEKGFVSIAADAEYISPKHVLYM